MVKTNNKKKTQALSKYTKTVTDTKDFSGCVETTLRISRSSKEEIDVDDLENIFTGIKKSLAPNTKLVIRALNGQRWFTFKGYDDEYLQIDSFEDYYKNKVADTHKFEKFAQVEITSLRIK